MTNKPKKLVFSALPLFAHHKNLRYVNQYQWRKIRAGIIEERGCQCEICGAIPKDETDQRNFHAHEEWAFDLTNHILDLQRIGMICHRCHQVDHMGLLEVKLKKGQIDKAQYDQVFEHYANVNGCTFQQAKTDYYKFSFQWLMEQSQLDPELRKAEWKYRLSCDFPYKDKMEEALIKKGLLAEDEEDPLF